MTGITIRKLAFGTPHFVERTTMGKARTPKVTKAQKQVEPTSVEVVYNLFDLPTAFHKAGLAGLVLLIESLRARLVLTSDEAHYTMTAITATFTFTEKLIDILFDDMYDAEPGQLKEKKAGTRNKKKVEAAEAKPKEAPPVPRFTALRGMLPDGDELWIKLWRDMIFQGPRSQPATWKPYKDRVAGKSYRLKDRNPWADLLSHHFALRNGQISTKKLSGSLLLGIQEETPEMVPCQGRLELNLLLHFWPLAVLVFVPQQLKAERKDGKLQITNEFVGYTLAVPEVSNLMDFLWQYPKVLSSFTKDARGYRPGQAVIDLPAESALAFLDDLALLTGLEVETGELRFSIGAVEYFHLVKDKRNVKTMAAGRVAPNQRLLSAYRAIVAPKDESINYRNPLFRQELLVALFDDQPWFRSFHRVLAIFEGEVFFRQNRKADEEKGPPRFALDIAKKFAHELKLFSNKLTRYKEMPEPAKAATQRPKPDLPVIVNGLVKCYLHALAETKQDCSLDKYRDSQKHVQWGKIPQEILDCFNEAKRKIAESMFMEFRSRKDQAFVDLFASRLFAIKQYLTEDAQLELADALVNSDNPERRDDLKTLTLLALSANS
jgi:CRISPR-associated protein Cmx8